MFETTLTEHSLKRLSKSLEGDSAFGSRGKRVFTLGDIISAFVVVKVIFGIAREGRRCCQIEVKVAMFSVYNNFLYCVLYGSFVLIFEKSKSKNK